MTATNVEKFSFPTATSTIVEGATSSGVSATTSIESTTFASSSSTSAAAATAAFFQSAYEVITTAQMIKD